MIGIDIDLRSDAKTRYPLSSIITKDTVEIKLTNDERRQLLTIFDFKKQANIGIILLVLSFFAFLLGIVFLGVSGVNENLFGAIITFLLPSIVLLLLGIYVLHTAPNIEKCTIKAYEFTVTDMLHRYYVRTSELDHKYYEENGLTKITKSDAVKYDPCRKDGNIRYYLFLQLDGKWVMLINNESYAPIRFGIKTGDKVRCAVLVHGEYCYFSLY